MPTMKVQIIPLNLISTLIVRWLYSIMDLPTSKRWSVADMLYISWSVWVQLGLWAVSWVNLLFCICENKGADQMRGNCAADQRPCFRYIDSPIPLISKSKIQASRHLLWLYSTVCVEPGWKPRIQDFSRCGSCMDVYLEEKHCFVECVYF